MDTQLRALLDEHAREIRSGILEYGFSVSPGGNWIEESDTKDYVLPDGLFFHGDFREININYHTAAYNGLKHRHDFFEVLFVSEGSVTTVVDREEIVLRAGDACILNPNAAHSVTKLADGEDFLVNVLLSKSMFTKSFFAMLFADERLNAFFNRHMLEAGSGGNYMLFRETRADNAVTELICELLHPQKYSAVVIEAILIKLFADFLRSRPEQEKGREKIIREILGYMSSHYAQISIENVAGKFHYHPKYLSSLIKRHTGINFREALLDIRLHQAVLYLTATDLTVDRIIELVGYRDRSFFYRAFRKRYRLTPAQYRAEHRQTDSQGTRLRRDGVNAQADKHFAVSPDSRTAIL